MEHAPGSSCRPRALVFRYRDPDRHLAGVRLVEGIGIPGELLDFRYDPEARGWLLELERPPVWRLEYLFELHHPGGGTELVCDPDNSMRVETAFGDKSVVECEDYREPGWLRAPAAAGSWRELAVPAPVLKAEVWTRIWSPEATTHRVVVAHDGPEYDKLGSLGQFSAAMVASGRVPPHHLVLLAPGDRDEWYSANPAYARALVSDVLPRVRAELSLPPDTRVVGAGASLGALGMLHAQRRYPGQLAGLFLQSGSFFRPHLDRQESGFRRYLRIVRFTGRVARAPHGPPVPAVLTCGRVEENVHNNREMVAVLRAQGYLAALYEVPDAHNYTGWRDAFDPYLSDLLRRAWGFGDA